METDGQAVAVRTEPVHANLDFPLRTREALLVLATFALGSVIWNMPPLAGLSESGTRFLATMVVAISLWVLDIFDDYIVGFMLLLAWVVLDIVPAKIALAGFSENAWFFTVGALGIAAAIVQTALLRRLSRRLLSMMIPAKRQKTNIFCLFSTGVLSGTLLPLPKARAALAVPLSQAISDAAGFTPRSNGSAVVALAAFVGFSQMSFIFLTGSMFNLIGWNFLPPSFKAEFGWLTWFLVGLPAAVCISAFMIWSVRFLLPLSLEENENLAANAVSPVNDAGPLTGKEWITLGILLLTVVGWTTTSLHGVNEAWVALAALLVFLLTGVLDRNGFKIGIDWGLIMFFGVLNSIAGVAEHVKVDAWFMAMSGQVLAPFAGKPLAFLLAVCLLVSTVRFFLRKAATAAMVGAAVLPLSDVAGIHPGIVLVVAMMAGECLLFAYQDGSYQVTYGGLGGKAFSHGQARKVLGAKYLATLLAVAVSVPYWRFLGFIR